MSHGMPFDLMEEMAKINSIYCQAHGIPMPKMPCGNTAALSKYEHEQMLADRAPVELPDFSQEDWSHDAFGEKQAKAMAGLFSLRDGFLKDRHISPDVELFLKAIRKIEMVAYAEVMDR